jgi:hypothetical protein
MKCNSSMGFIKRAIPFLGAFSLALLITSFFVDLRGPRFGFRAHGWERHQRMERLAAENERLQAEVERLRAEMEMRDAAPMLHPGDRDIGLDFAIPAPPMPPGAPVAPHAHR